MIETVLSLGSSSGTLEVAQLAADVAVAVLLGLALAALYCVRNRHTASFVVTLAILPAIVCVVIALVNGNVGAGVAVAGTFSLVRFRSVAGSAKEIGFVFLAMCVGLACGMGALAVAALTAVAVGGVYLACHLLGLGAAGPVRERSLRVTIPEDLDFEGAFDDVFARYLESCELVSVKTANMGSVFRLVYNVRLRADASAKALIDELRCRNGNLEVALTHQEVTSYEL